MSDHDNIINVSSYVAIGDSIASGYTDGGLCYSGQINSYPNLIAEQFKSIGGGNFRQPLVDQDSAGIGFSGNSCLILKEKFGTEPIARTLA
jgi:hypothetical protein